MIKTVIFDIGKVLVGYDWRATMMEMFNADKTFADKLFDTMFCHGVWDELDRGVWTKDQLLEGFIKTSPELEKEIRYFFDHAGVALHQYEFTKDWIRELKAKGLKLLFLSNYSQHIIDQNPECLDFIPMLDGGIFSCDVKLIKPDKAIYEKIIKEYNLTPGEAVFLDDKLANVEAAISCGMKGIHVKNHEQAALELKELCEN